MVCSWPCIRERGAPGCWRMRRLDMLQRAHVTVRCIEVALAPRSAAACLAGHFTATPCLMLGALVVQVWRVRVLRPQPRGRLPSLPPPPGANRQGLPRGHRLGRPAHHPHGNWQLQRPATPHPRSLGGHPGGRRRGAGSCAGDKRGAEWGGALSGGRHACGNRL